MSFLSDAQIESIRERFGTPVYVYDQRRLEEAADCVLGFPVLGGPDAPAAGRLVARFAMKALPTAAVLRIFDARGLHIDASSGFEAERALRAGIAPERIQITAQELPKDLKGLVQRGVLFNACSLHQLRRFGELFPVDEALALARDFDLRLTGMHTHIGSGGDPEVWKHCAALTLKIAARLPDLQRLSLGGGFKVARMPGETSADLQEIGEALRPALSAFAAERGPDFQLEVEPGTFLVANAGLILAEIIDVVDTGADGYRFLKVDSGMTELLRPALYGAQHPLEVVAHGRVATEETDDYVVAGHCCESGDILTPAPGDPEGLAPRRLMRAQIGDTLVVGGAGAYASGLAGKNYNSFPEAAEVLIDREGEAMLIRQRQTLEQALQNEV
jgi:diaminopimelate decarboxylase